MKVVVSLFIGFLMCFSTSAQNWVEDFEEAKEIAKSERKPIILVFEGSDWCPPCKRLNKNVLSTNIFRKHAEENYVMVKVDFLRKTAISQKQLDRNNKLSSKYNPKGKIPRIIVISEQGKVLEVIKYKNNSAKEFIALLDKVYKA